MSFSIIFLLPPLLHRISKSPTYLTRTSLSSGYFLRRSLFPVYIFPANLTPTLITSSIHTRSQRRKIEGRMDELDTIKIIAFYICRFTLLYRLSERAIMEIVSNDRWECEQYRLLNEKPRKRISLRGSSCIYIPLSKQYRQWGLNIHATLLSCHVGYESH